MAKQIKIQYPHTPVFILIRYIHAITQTSLHLKKTRKQLNSAI